MGRGDRVVTSLTGAIGAATNDPTGRRKGYLTGRDESATEGQNTAPPSAEVAAPPSLPLWELMSPLAAGSMVAHGWRLAELSAVQNGSCVAVKRGPSEPR
jgi:hypothetical protein